jgi:hypothetical protein
MVSSKCWKGANLVSSLGYSNDFFVISQILFNMLEINIYSIIDSKVFGVKIGVNFLFAIVIERFNDCTHVVEDERMQLKSTGGKNAN